MNAVAMVMLSIGAAGFMYRLLRGPSLPDRVVGLDGLLSIVVIGIIVAAAAGRVVPERDASSAAVGGTDEVCVFCHTPHAATNDQGHSAPLWNRSLANGNYSLYQSTTIDAVTSRYKRDHADPPVNERSALRSSSASDI